MDKTWTQKDCKAWTFKYMPKNSKFLKMVRLLKHLTNKIYMYISFFIYEICIKFDSNGMFAIYCLKVYC